MAKESMKRWSQTVLPPEPLEIGARIKVHDLANAPITPGRTHKASVWAFVSKPSLLTSAAYTLWSMLAQTSPMSEKQRTDELSSKKDRTGGSATHHGPQCGSARSSSAEGWSS